MSTIRLQKYFTDCGVISRRAAEEQIRLGRVRVNGSVANIGDSINPDTDRVEWNGKIIVPMCDERICIMLNKPRGFVTTMSDEKERKNVSMLVSSLGTRVYPVGRLDMDSDGLLLLTNDGALANLLTHPKHSIPKIYRVQISGSISAEALEVLRSPMMLDGYKIQPVKTEIITAAHSQKDKSVLEMTLYEGRNRQIRKMCERAGLKITKLTRVAIGNIKLGGLSEGKWRRLTKDELAYLLGEDKEQKGHKENA